MSKVTAVTEKLGQTFSSLVISEVDPRWSRENVTIAASSGDLVAGLVLTRKEDGTYGPLTEAEKNLVGSPQAVLLEAVVNSAENQEALVIRRGAVLAKHYVKLDSSIVTKYNDVYAALSDLGIVITDVKHTYGA